MCRSRDRRPRARARPTCGAIVMTQRCARANGRMVAVAGAAAAAACYSCQATATSASRGLSNCTHTNARTRNTSTLDRSFIFHHYHLAATLSPLRTAVAAAAAASARALHGRRARSRCFTTMRLDADGGLVKLLAALQRRSEQRRQQQQAVWRRHIAHAHATGCLTASNSTSVTALTLAKRAHTRTHTLLVTDGAMSRTHRRRWAEVAAAAAIQ